MGIAAIRCLTIRELKAILAHEYAHFSHADTFWSRFIYQVSLSIQVAMYGMRQSGGFLVWINPFYLFFFCYHKAYSILCSGFSRSREFLADRMACALYGSDVFCKALEKICTDASLFHQTIHANLIEMLKKKKAYVNMYLAYSKWRDEGLTKKEREKLYKKLLADEPSIFDSHPTFGERIEAAGHLPKARRHPAKAVKGNGPPPPPGTKGNGPPPPPAPKGAIAARESGVAVKQAAVSLVDEFETSAMQLFEEPEEIEKEMTDALTAAWDKIMKQYKIK
jgi:hypothetical protein